MGATTRSRNAAAVVMMMVIVAAALLGAGGAEGATARTVSCGDVVNALAPCGAFLTGAGPAVPPAGCCQGALSLRRMATTADARRAMCRCMVQSAPSFGVLPIRARVLPARCNLAVDLPGVGGGGGTDCDKIS